MVSKPSDTNVIDKYKLIGCILANLIEIAGYTSVELKMPQTIERDKRLKKLRTIWNKSLYDLRVLYALLDAKDT